MVRRYSWRFAGETALGKPVVENHLMKGLRLKLSNHNPDRIDAKCSHEAMAVVRFSI
jgi:hypothetical protein